MSPKKSSKKLTGKKQRPPPKKNGGGASSRTYRGRLAPNMSEGAPPGIYGDSTTDAPPPELIRALLKRIDRMNGLNPGEKKNLNSVVWQILIETTQADSANLDRLKSFLQYVDQISADAFETLAATLNDPAFKMSPNVQKIFEEYVKNKKAPSS